MSSIDHNDITSLVTPGPSTDFRANLTNKLKGQNTNKRINVSEEVHSILKKKAVENKREKVGLTTPSPTPTPVAPRYGTLPAIPEI